MKTQKILGITLAVGFVGAAILPVGNTTTAHADSVDLADQSFVQFVTADTTYSGALRYTHTPLYNEDLEVSGREYTFTIGQVEGYALLAEITNANGTYYEVEELFYNPDSPFNECEGLPVYVAHRLYIDYTDNAFYNLSNGEQLTAEAVAMYAAEGFLYYGGGTMTTYYQTVDYATKTTDEYSIQYDLPNYQPQSPPVDCANVAGCIVMGYYDRFYENLIPNYQVYLVFGPTIIYRSESQEIFDLGTNLSNLMGGGNGTTFSGFQSGMSAYVSGKGLTYSSSTVFTNGAFDYAKYKQSVQAGKPVVVFMSTFSLLNSIAENDTTDTISNAYVNATHVMVGCGYRTDTYYNENGVQIGVRRYLKVATGTVTHDIGYLNLEGTGTMDKAISVDIH